MRKSGEFDVAALTDLVQCSVHKTRRLAKFCTPKPTYNADGRTVGYTYSCKKESECQSRTTMAGGQQDMIGDAGGVVPRASELPRPLVGTASPPPVGSAVTTEAAVSSSNLAPPPPVFATATAGMRGRYYDMSLNQSGDSSFAKKVCWWCGMDDHEKPQCPNQLCRRCHGPIGREFNGHVCHVPNVSSFVTIDDLSEEHLATVQCPNCGDFGHLDCNKVEPMDKRRQLSCSYCGNGGHHAFDCPHVKPDSWLEQQLRLGGRDGRGGGGGGGRSQRIDNNNEDDEYNQRFRNRNSSYGNRYEPQQQQRSYESNPRSFVNVGDRGGASPSWNQQQPRYDDSFQQRRAGGYSTPILADPVRVVVGGGSGGGNRGASGVAPAWAANQQHVAPAHNYANRYPAAPLPQQNQQQQLTRDRGRGDDGPRRRSRDRDRHDERRRSRERDHSRKRTHESAGSSSKWKKYEPPKFSGATPHHHRQRSPKQAKRRRSESSDDDFQF